MAGTLLNAIDELHDFCRGAVQQPHGIEARVVREERQFRGSVICDQPSSHIVRSLAGPYRARETSDPELIKDASFFSRREYQRRHFGIVLHLGDAAALGAQRHTASGGFNCIVKLGAERQIFHAANLETIRDRQDAPRVSRAGKLPMLCPPVATLKGQDQVAHGPLARCGPSRVGGEDEEGGGEEGGSAGATSLGVSWNTSATYCTRWR